MVYRFKIFEENQGYCFSSSKLSEQQSCSFASRLYVLWAARQQTNLCLLPEQMTQLHPLQPGASNESYIT